MSDHIKQAKRIHYYMDCFFGEATKRYAELLKPSSELDDILHVGSHKAMNIALDTLRECQKAVGLI